MNWIKDHLMVILAAVAVALLVAAAVFFALWRIGVADLKAAELRAQNAVSASNDNATKLKALQADYNHLVERQQLDTAAALRAGERISALQQRLREETAVSNSLREKLRRERPDIDEYLRQPVPVELYDRLLERGGKG